MVTTGLFDKWSTLICSWYRWKQARNSYMGEKGILQNMLQNMNWNIWITTQTRTKTYRGRHLGWGYNHPVIFLILLNVIVIVLIFFQMYGDPRNWKLLETQSYKEPEVRTRAYKVQNTQLEYGEQEKRYTETKESSESTLIKTATRKIVDKSLIVAPAPTVSK